MIGISYVGITHASAAQTLTLIAEESFDYTGNIVGKNGGSGFTNAWQDAYYNGNGGSNYSIQTPGLTYTGLTTSGGYIYSCSSSPNQVCGVSRQIPTQNTGVIYIQLLANFGSQYGSGTPNLRFNNAAGARVGGLGSNGGPYGAKVSILDDTMNPKSDGTSSAGVLNTLNLVILRIDYAQNISSLYINPNLSTFSYINPPVADGTIPNFAPEIKTIEFFARNSVKFDEIKIYSVSGTTAAEDDAAAKAEAEAALKKRDAQRVAEIKAARAFISAALVSKQNITAADLVRADLPITTVQSLNLAYQELISVKYSLTTPLSLEALNEIKARKFMKYAIYERITGVASGDVYTRDLVRYEVINADMPMKQLATSQLMKLPVAARDSITKVDNFYSEAAAQFAARKAHLAATITRIKNR